MEAKPDTCGLFKYKTIKQYTVKHLLNETVGVVSTLLGREKGRLLFPQRIRREEGGICQVAPGGMHGGRNHVVVDVACGPCGAAPHEAKGQPAPCAVVGVWGSA